MFDDSNASSLFPVLAIVPDAMASASNNIPAPPGALASPNTDTTASISGHGASELTAPITLGPAIVPDAAVSPTDHIPAPLGASASPNTNPVASMSGHGASELAAPSNLDPAPSGIKAKDPNDKRYRQGQKMVLSTAITLRYEVRPPDRSHTTNYPHRNICAADWLEGNPEGTKGQFNWHIDNLPPEKVEVYPSVFQTHATISLTQI